MFLERCHLVCTTLMQHLRTNPSCGNINVMKSEDCNIAAPFKLSAPLVMWR